MEDVAAGRAVVGGGLMFSDGTKGIIFYLNENKTHGLVVSLDCIFAKWEAVKKSRECHDIIMLPNEEGTKALTYRVGENNTATIINQIGAYNAPAASWCASKGEGWYLPSAGELWYLFTVANSQLGQAGLISISLINNGGKPFTERWYWTSTENDYDEAINVSVSGSMSSEDKVDILPVYAVRAF